MGFKLFKSRRDRIKFISSVDEAVDVSTEQHRTAYANYLKTLDPSLLVLNGEPLTFTLRPLDVEVYEIACRDSRGVAIRDLYTDSVTARQLLRLSCEDVTEWPKEWGDKEKAFRFEYGRKVLSPEFVCDLPPAVCREAAAVLLDTLPLPELDQAKDGDDGGDVDNPFGVGSGEK